MKSFICVKHSVLWASLIISYCLAGSLLGTGPIMYPVENDDNCPTEGTAFDSDKKDTGTERCSAYWIGAKTKSIRKT